MANKAQKFLLDNKCGDLILNNHRTTKPEDRIYASDIMMMFLDSERGQNVDTSERQLTIPDVSNNEALDFSDGVAFANYIEKKWMEYRSITNNEDAWSFKQWLVGK